MTTLIADADIQCFEAALVHSDWVQFDESEPGFWEGDLAAACDMVDEAMRIAQEIVGADDIIVVLSDPTGQYFRKDLHPDYKANRSGGKPRPDILQDVKRHVRDTWEAKWKRGLEGDDVLGLYHTQGKRTVAWSLDKDMFTLPGEFIRSGRLEDFESFEQVTVEPVEADRFWMKQALMGDATDGYKGCPGIGPKRADERLEGCLDLEEMWAAVVDTYREKGLDVEDALLQARLARILRWGDWDLEAQEVRLWTPPWSV